MGAGLELAARQSWLVRRGAAGRVGGAAGLAPSHGGRTEQVRVPHAARISAGSSGDTRRLRGRRWKRHCLCRKFHRRLQRRALSLRLEAGNEVLVPSHGYPAVRNAIRSVTELVAAHITEAVISFPRPQSAAIVAGIGAALTPRTRIAVIDHITSPSALVFADSRDCRVVP